MDNPINLRTRKASGVLGALIRSWALLRDEELPQGFTRLSDRSFVISAEDLRAMMRGAGLTDGTREPGQEPEPEPDFWLRDDIEEVELIRRKPERASLLLPERDVMEHQERFLSDGDPFMLPDFYLVETADKNAKAPDTPAVGEDHALAHRSVTMGKDPFRGFLDPYLALYLCTQCK